MSIVSSREVLQQRLQEAEEALHKLQMGQREVSVSVDGIGQSTYQQTSVPHLERYILNLKRQLGVAGRRTIRLG